MPQVHEAPEGAKPVEFSQRNVRVAALGAEWFSLLAILVYGDKPEVLSAEGKQALVSFKRKLAAQLTEEATQ